MPVAERVTEKFHPYDAVDLQNRKAIPRWLELRQGHESRALDELKKLNLHWFAQPMAFELTQPMLWLINAEFTRRGVAPGWRGVHRFVPAVEVAPPPAAAGVARLGQVAMVSLMKRWIDLEWLRATLGEKHQTHIARWQKVFSSDIRIATTAMARINAIHFHGGGKFGTTTKAHTLMHELSVPKLIRLGLTGLIDRDSGELVRNARKRVERNCRPPLEALMDRVNAPLLSTEVNRRLMHCEAIELAVGRPSDAATVFKWMTGATVTRQSMHEMRDKLAKQCSLTTRAWRSSR